MHSWRRKIGLDLVFLYVASRKGGRVWVAANPMYMRWGCGVVMVMAWRVLYGAACWHARIVGLCRKEGVQPDVHVFVRHATRCDGVGIGYAGGVQPCAVVHYVGTPAGSAVFVALHVRPLRARDKHISANAVSCSEWRQIGRRGCRCLGWWGGRNGAPREAQALRTSVVGARLPAYDSHTSLAALPHRWAHPPNPGIDLGYVYGYNIPLLHDFLMASEETSRSLLTP